MREPLLIEVGTEELPSSYMPVLEKQLQTAFKVWLTEENWDYDSCKVFLTPRRMIFLILAIEDKQHKQPEWVKGPPVTIALNQNNEQTPALTGFLNRCHTETFEIRTLENGQYVFGLAMPDNKTLIDFVSQKFPPFLENFPFEKMMKWAQYQFIRPIKWLLALYGSKLIPLKILDTESSLVTRLLQGQGEQSVSNPDEYFLLMKKTGILLSIDDRKQAIQSSLRCQYPDPVLTENACRTEVPVMVEASYPESFSNLPKEILETVLLYQMKCFPIYQPNDNQLTNRFRFVMNGNREINLVRRGFEKVMTARLSDADYFYSQDRLIPFSSRSEKLSKIMFMEKLGSMDQKIQRLKHTAERMKLFEKLPGLSETITYFKLDLTTLLVQELTELQGVVGKIYALQSGLSEEVSQAIEESYLPKSDQDSLPKSTLGQWISLLDRWDTWIGIHCIQISLSSSVDPLGIRRTVNGFLSILRQNPLDFSFHDFLQASLAAYQEVNQLNFQAEKVTTDWKAYFNQRMRSLLSNQYRYDLILAVLNDIRHPNRIEQQISLLEANLQNEALKDLYQSFVRMQKILNTSYETGSYKTELMQADAEKALWEAGVEVQHSLQSVSNIDQMLPLLYKLNQPIQRFFEEVMVMTEDYPIRENRLRLLSWLLSIMSSFADFSKIVFDGGNE